MRGVNTPICIDEDLETQRWHELVNGGARILSQVCLAAEIKLYCSANPFSQGPGNSSKPGIGLAEAPSHSGMLEINIL